MTYHVLCASREYCLTFGITLPLITRCLSTIFHVRPTSATVSDDIGKARDTTTTEDRSWRMVVLGVQRINKVVYRGHYLEAGNHGPEQFAVECGHMFPKPWHTKSKTTQFVQHIMHSMVVRYNDGVTLPSRLPPLQPPRLEVPAGTLDYQSVDNETMGVLPFLPRPPQHLAGSAEACARPRQRG
ncbi:hypothetical protein CBL_13582, partial [Carabus blaptoides fortunei]